MPVIYVLWSLRRKGSVQHVCKKIEADSSIRSKVIKGPQNFEIGSRDPGHAHLRVVLWSAHSSGASCMPVPNFKRIARFNQKVIRGVQKLRNWIM